MLIGPQNLAAGVANVRGRIAAAARQAGRDPQSVTLVAVSKTQPAETVAAARAAGLTDFGENYLQEALPKIAALEALQDGAPAPVWHFIGALQSNKTRTVAEYFHWVHTVDRLKIAERLSEQRPYHAPPLNVCLQVKLVAEDTKSGASPEDLPTLATAIARLPRLRLRGLMCIPPATDDIALQRARFAELRVLADTLRARGLPLDVLSMGMSADFEAAILEGATHVRVGTAIFGAREAA